MTEHTPGPWVGFNVDKKLDSIMPAGRDGDICTFRKPPSDADALLILAAPALVKALKDLSDMYAHAWDRADGGLTMFGASVARFENAHHAAQIALHLASGIPVPVYFEEDEQESDALAASASE